MSIEIHILHFDLFETLIFTSFLFIHIILGVTVGGQLKGWLLLILHSGTTPYSAQGNIKDTGY